MRDGRRGISLHFGLHEASPVRMIWLSSSTIAALRTQLLVAGARPTIFPAPPGGVGTLRDADHARSPTLASDNLLRAAVGDDLAANDQADFLESAAYAELVAELGPFAEAMFLMMSADNDASPDEYSVLRGALRNLTDGQIRSVQLDALIDEARVRLTKSTRKARLEAAAAAIATSPARAEVAFVLAAALAMADGAVADGENAFLEQFAALLGLDEATCERLFSTVEVDLFGGRSIAP
jgi:tellurite resistance protein